MRAVTLTASGTQDRREISDRLLNLA